MLLIFYDTLANMTKGDWPIIGNPQALNFFDSLLAIDKKTPFSIGGVYLVVGPSNSGRLSAIEHFLTKLLSSSKTTEGTTIDMWPDVIRVKVPEEKREIGVDQARELSARLSHSSFSDSYRVGIIEDADALSTEAANALLKTLEEAKERVIIFLLVEREEHVPATIVSRSQRIFFRPVNTDEIYEWLITTHGLERPLAKNIARLCLGCPGLALQFVKNPDLLEAYLAPARVLLATFKQRLYQRWKSASELMSGLKGSEAHRAALAIIESWQSIGRDLRLPLLNQPDLIRYAFFDREIQDAAANISLSETRQLEERLQKARAYLAANVGPVTVLENILITL